MNDAALTAKLVASAETAKQALAIALKSQEEEKALLKKIDDLQIAIQNQSNPSQALLDAADALDQQVQLIKSAVDASDALVPDAAPTPTP